MRCSCVTLTLLVFFGIVNCNDLNLAGRLESPAGDSSPLYVVSTNIPATLSTGGTFNASVTFNRAVAINGTGISFDNGASIANLMTTDNITWTFTINFPSSGTFTIFFGAGIIDQSGRAISPSSQQIIHSFT